MADGVYRYSMASHTPSSRAIGVPAVACSLFAVSGVRQLSFSKSEGDCQVVSGSRRGFARLAIRQVVPLC